MSTHTVAETGTYTDTRSGLRYRYEAGAVIPMETAYACGMAGAALPAAPPALTDDQVDAVLHRTITNYAPDGALQSNALIDLAGAQDFATKFWYGLRGSETLTYLAASGQTPARVRVACPGQAWEEGVMTADDADAWGCKTLPAGRYRIGVNVSVTGFPGNKRTLRLTATTGNHMGYVGSTPILVVDGAGAVQRFWVEAVLNTPGSLGLIVQHDRIDYPDGAAVVAGQIYLANLMITDGEALVYRDGDAAGWAWAGAPYPLGVVGPAAVNVAAKPSPAPPAVPLREVVCPRCLPGMRRILVRAATGSVVEAYCWHCRYRAVVVVR